MALPLRSCLLITAVFCMIGGLGVSPAQGGVFVAGRSVGGVSIDAGGVVSNPTVDELGTLQQVLQAGLEEVPTDLDQPSELRFVSLRKLEEEIARCREQFLPLPEAVQCLAGLQRIQYVLVYPERNDIVLAGPAEGWQADRWGNIVGKTSGRPVLLLDDLMAALRARRSSADGGLSCSIDPTPEGIERLRQLVARIRTMQDPHQTMALVEQALGPQIISVTGVPRTSHFARVMVAADFRMKRIAMNFEPAPVDDMPSYLHLIKAGRTGMQSVLPRWWLAPNYEPLHKSPDGLAWEIRGQGVKCMTEDDHFAAEGTRTHTGKASADAQRWAEMMTAKFDELAAKDSTFGHLRNVMDLAVVAALIEKEQLLQQASLDLPRMLEDELLEQFNAPETVASQASFIQKGRNYVISASGGVEVYPWEIVGEREESTAVAAVRTRSEPTGSWWWD